MLHPKHEAFQLWSSAWDHISSYWEKETYPTPLFISARWGFQKLTAALLACGVCCTTLSKSGDTALHLGAQHGHANVVHLLIEKGADVNVQNYYSTTPLHHACSGGYLNIVELLVQKGA
ncbi:ankyrin, partial [Paxillus ammoniavirescens]